MYGAPNSAYDLEFFADEASGQTYLGSTVVTTDRTGLALIRFYVPTRPKTTVFTATATSAAFNTSEFSDGVPLS